MLLAVTLCPHSQLPNEYFTPLDGSFRFTYLIIFPYASTRDNRLIHFAWIATSSWDCFISYILDVHFFLYSMYQNLWHNFSTPTSYPGGTGFEFRHQGRIFRLSLVSYFLHKKLSGLTPIKDTATSNIIHYYHLSFQRYVTNGNDILSSDKPRTVLSRLMYSCHCSKFKCNGFVV
jgi:hypothetical protein